MSAYATRVKVRICYEFKLPVGGRYLPGARAELARGQFPVHTRLLEGDDAIGHMVSQPDVDIVLTALWVRQGWKAPGRRSRQVRR